MNVEFKKIIEIVEKKSRFLGYRLSCKNVEEVERAQIGRASCRERV